MPRATTSPVPSVRKFLSTSDHYGACPIGAACYYRELMKIRVGIVGLGGVADRIHLPACRAVPELEVAGGCDPTPEAGAEVWNRAHVRNLRRDAGASAAGDGDRRHASQLAFRDLPEINRGRSPCLLRKTIHARRRGVRSHYRAGPPAERVAARKQPVSLHDFLPPDEGAVASWRVRPRLLYPVLATDVPPAG